METGKKLLRLEADERGESHFVADEIALTLRILRRPPPRCSPRQPKPRRVGCCCACRSAGSASPIRRRGASSSSVFRARCVSSPARAMRIVDTGDAWLMADTTGKGHTSEVVSDIPVDAVIVQLE